MKKKDFNQVTIEGRRKFLRTIPAAAIAGLTMSELLPVPADAQPTGPPPPLTKENSAHIEAASLIADGKALPAPQGKEGVNKTLYMDKNFKMALWSEKGNSAEEFEWHEGTDHILTIIEGSTSYEVGGAAQGGHSVGGGTWKAPSSPGFTSTTLNKGDIFVIRRGTPHRRVTRGSVIFTLLSPITPVSA